jgi:hypothetical protein
VETGETEEKLRFSRKRKGREKRSRPTQLRIRPSPPCHATIGLEEELLDEEEQEYAFLESVLEGEREAGHPGAEPGQAHHSTSIQAQQGSDRAKMGPRGTGPGARTRGAPAPSPAPLGPNRLAPTAFNAVRLVRGWVR